MKILVFAGFSKSLITFRKELLSDMVQKGHDVIAIGPELGCEEKLKEIGVRFTQVKFNRLTTNPISEIRLIIKLLKIMNKEKPDLYFGYTIKPVIYGSLAAWLSGIKKRYAMVTGLGSMFIEGNKVRNYIRIITKILYRIGFLCSTKVFFQNNDDIKDMTNMKLLPIKKCLLVNGSGVNLDYYTPSSLPDKNIFLFIGSIMKDKGICEYIEAASIVKEKIPSTRCWIVGPIDHRISSLTEAELKHYEEIGSIKYFGSAEDVRIFLDQCRFYVLPSYREGTPRSVLEAMAKGRPILTTDAPGCRETVINGRNGFLIPIRDAAGLAEKMIWMVEHPDEIEEMAKNSLLLVREKYDVNLINKYMLKEMCIA